MLVCEPSEGAIFDNRTRFAVGRWMSSLLSLDTSKVSMSWVGVLENVVCTRMGRVSRKGLHRAKLRFWEAKMDDSRGSASPTTRQ